MLHWPGWRLFGVSMACGLAECVVFVIVYGGANWITNQHTWRIAAHTPCDLSIPLVPAMMPIYLSLTPLLWSMAFVLRSAAEVLAFVGTLMVATIVAGILFVLLPAEHAYQPITSEELGGWQPCYQLLRAIALDHNFFPSLHVAFTTIAVRVMLRHASALSGLPVLLWGAAIIVSTLLVHEHYLIDVAAGLLLGWMSVSLCFDAWLPRAQSRREQKSLPSPASDPAPSA
jgi:membrane-associated phospholipid phosphatase